MATLYYGSGNCSIEGSDDIRGVEIRFRGNISIIDKSPEGFAIAHQKDGVVIFPVGSSGTLNNLFDYTGDITILSVIVADNNAKRVSCSIKRVMDYAELLNTNAEDITTNSEDLNAGHTYGNKVAKTTVDRHIVENLHTSTHDGALYLESGLEFHGGFHVHLKDNSAMTGGSHDVNSQPLYFKQARDGVLIDKLVPTKNPKLTLPALKLQKRRR